MKYISMFIFSTFLLQVAGCTTAESQAKAGFDFSGLDKVAVVDVIGDIGGETARNQVSDFFVMELLKKGYSAVERAQVQNLLKEQKFQQSEVTTAQSAAQAGKILNVPAVLIVNIPALKEEMSITAKMINVEDGSILWMASGSGTTGRTLSTVTGAVIGAGAGAAAAGEDEETVGAIAGGVLGGVAGRALSPQTAEKAKEIIKKMCQSLPYRAGG